MLKLPPFPALRAFEAVSRLGSVTRAAEELHVTHSAISHQVRQLEEFLGIALIDRSARRMDLTPSGRSYAYQIRQSLQQIGSTTDRITQRNEPEYLTIGVLPSFGTHWLLPRLKDFWKDQPNWRIELVASLEMLDFEQTPVDCAIRFGNIESFGAHSEFLMNEWQLMVAAQNDTRYHGEQSASDAISVGPIILANENLINWSIAANLDSPTLQQPIVVNDSNLSLEAVRNGFGAALTRWSIAANWVTQGHLKRVTSHMPKHTSSYHLVWPNRNHGSTKLNIFKSWLKQQCINFEQDTARINPAQHIDNSVPFSFLHSKKINLPL